MCVCEGGEEGWFELVFKRHRWGNDLVGGGRGNGEKGIIVWD